MQIVVQVQLKSQSKLSFFSPFFKSFLLFLYSNVLLYYDYDFFMCWMTQIWPPWPWPLGFEHETSIRLSPMLNLIFILVLSKIQRFLIFLWIFKGILNIQYGRRDLDLKTGADLDVVLSDISFFFGKQKPCSYIEMQRFLEL
jgi:hypothetical protein